MSQIGLDMAPDDSGTGGRRPRRARSGRGPLVVAVLAVVVVVLGVIVGVRTLGGGTQDFTGEGTGTVTVVVAKGDSLRAIGRKLAAAGVVASDGAFVDAANGDPRAQSIAPGAYAMRNGMSAASAVSLMLDPTSRVVKKVVIPEGTRLDKIVSTTAKSTGLSADALRASLAKADQLGLPAYAGGNPEGFLFPATYEFAPGVSADKVVSAMLARFKQAATESDLAAGAADRKLTPLQVLTVASLVQGESAPADYDKVARVIYNRLRDDMPLQLDSTVNYALGTSELHLSADQLATDSPYNTYQHTGLPPGPINSPGDAAIQAALNPAKGSWLYFVSTDPANQVTEFATTYDQFLALKKKFQANGG
jgi:UPF0755 protein